MEQAVAEAAAWRATKDARIRDTGTAQESMETMYDHGGNVETVESMYEKGRTEDLSAELFAWEEERLFEESLVQGNCRPRSTTSSMGRGR